MERGCNEFLVAEDDVDNVELQKASARIHTLNFELQKASARIMYTCTLCRKTEWDFGCELNLVNPLSQDLTDGNCQTGVERRQN